MITFSSVTKQFGDETTAIENVSFEIQPGEFVVITGHSGSGKTTLMRLLTREYIPTDGEIVFDNQPLSEIRTNQVHHHRRKIGVVFQDYKLLPELNVWENIALALNIIGKPQSEIEARVSDLLRLVGLVEKAFLFPSQLSGGEAQRVSIARALATGPSVIFADEPTGNLDADTSTSIARLLRKINTLGTIVMLATHDTGVLETLKDERHLQLEKGRLIKDTGSTSKTKKVAVHTEPPAEKPTKKTTSEENLESKPETLEDEKKATPSESKSSTQPTANEVTPDEALETPAKPKRGFKLPSFRLPFGRKPAAVAETKPEAPPEHHKHEFHDDKNDDDTVDITIKVEKL